MIDFFLFPLFFLNANMKCYINDDMLFLRRSCCIFFQTNFYCKLSKMQMTLPFDTLCFYLWKDLTDNNALRLLFSFMSAFSEYDNLKELCLDCNCNAAGSQCFAFCFCGREKK